MDSLSFSPIASAEDTDTVSAVSEAYRHYAACNRPEAKVAQLAAAMVQVFGDHTMPIEKGHLRFRKRPAVL
jgi:hypothetical protein